MKTSFNVSRNVSNIENIEITLPSTFSELAAGENVMRINGSFEIAAVPSFTQNVDIEIDLEADMEVTPSNYYLGPYTFEVSTTSTDCYAITSSREVNEKFVTDDTKLGMGTYSVQMIGTPNAGISGGQDPNTNENNYFIYYDYKSWIPFVVDIAQGTTILSASLEVYAVTSNTGVGTAKQKIGCENIDDAVTPTTFDELNLKRYTYSYTSDEEQPVWVAGTKYTYDVTTCVQEVINIATWSSGNTLAIMTRGSAASRVPVKEFASFENVTYDAPKLIIIYE